MFVRGLSTNTPNLIFLFLKSSSLSLFPVRGLRVFFSRLIHNKDIHFAQTFENDVKRWWRETNWTAKGDFSQQSTDGDP